MMETMRGFRNVRLSTAVDLSKPHKVQNSTDIALVTGPFHMAFLSAERSDGESFAIEIRVDHTASMTIETVFENVRTALGILEGYRMCECTWVVPCPKHKQDRLAFFDRSEQNGQDA